MPAEATATAVAFAQRRSELERSARAGDAIAAAELGGVLATCVNYHGGTVEEIEDLVVNGLATGVEVPVLGGRPISPELLVLVLQDTQRELESRCHGLAGAVTFDDQPAAIAWLQQAADAGRIEAMLDYVRFTYQDFDDGKAMLVHADEVLQRKRRAVTYLAQAIAAGNADALQLRAEIQSEGGVLPRNSPAAYTDAYAYSLTAQGRQWPARQRELYLDALAQPLDAAQREQARQQGLALWQRCCSQGAGR
ncbi:hypothetical protein DFR29_1078 [Tahibacter aquaticus]|uniref:Sel1 repeat-containing protein n=1 Tax=Tahibacter aquaticus TaxID=520092 RepID=A0A4R6YW06_9GAMM|nr:hypothetical protein DFR29_1078 [Tahibacter aquaticus]